METYGSVGKGWDDSQREKLRGMKVMGKKWWETHGDKTGAQRRK